MSYLLPFLDVVGNQPDWSVENFPLISTGFIKTQLVRTRGSLDEDGVVMTGSMRFVVDGGESLVDLIFFQSVQRWTFVVARDFGRCLLISSTVRPSQVAKYPAWIARVQVETTGQPAQRWRY